MVEAEQFRLGGEEFPALNQRLFIIQPTFDAVDLFTSVRAVISRKNIQIYLEGLVIIELSLFKISP